MNLLLRVDVHERKVLAEEGGDEESRWGGRSLIAHVLLREVPPTCEPLGRRNHSMPSRLI